MNSTNTNQGHETERNHAVEQELRAVRSSAPPADLFDKLQQDLATSIDQDAWDQAAQGDEPGIAPIEKARPNWWQSTSLRAAAAIFTVVGAGWFLSRMEMPDAPMVKAPTNEVGTSEATADVIVATQGVGNTRSELAKRDRDGAEILEGAATSAGVDLDDADLNRAQIASGSGADTVFREPSPRAESAQSRAPKTEFEATELSRLRELRGGARVANPNPKEALELGTETVPARKDGSAKLLNAEEDRQLKALGYVTAKRSEPVASQPSVDAIAPPPPALQEGVTVTSEAPLLDERKLKQGTVITQSELEKIPTAREPWAVLNQSPGTVVDRVNVGGTESGQAASFRDPAVEPSSPKPVARPNAKSMESNGTFKERVERLAESESSAAPHEKIFSGDVVANESNRRAFDQRSRRPLAEFDAMTFRDFGISPFVDAKQDAESTFGLDVDTGSYTIARNYLNRGALPPPESVRVEEFLNALDFHDAAPSRGDFAITAEGALTPYPVPSTDSRSASERPDRDDDTRRAWLRVGVKAKAITAQQRKPTALTFLVDTSGSMKQENRIGIVKQSLRLLVDELQPRDTVAIVTYGSRGQVLLNHSSDKPAILSTIDRLFPQGSTNLQEGMEHAYRLASENLLATGEGEQNRRNHRVLLLSDGVANVGFTDAEALLRNVAHWATRGIELTAVGVGMGNYNDELLERLADRGDGRYAYVDRMEEARRLFVENLTGTLQTVGKDARVQVTFDPDVVRQYRLVGYENRDIPDAAFRNVNTDGGEIGSGHSVTALYELDLFPSARRRADLATIALVYRPSDSQELVEMSKKVRVDAVSNGFTRATPSLRLATLTARFAELLRVSPHVEGDLSELFLEAQQLIPAFPGDRRVVELADLIGKARDLMLAR